MKKVWLRGVPGRGSEVIELLKEWGGKTSPFALAPKFAEDSKYILFVDHDGLIDFVHETHELSKVIMDCYEPIGLPAIQEPLWDDGTLLIRRDIHRNYGYDFAIFNAIEKKVVSFKAYFAITTDNVVSSDLDYLHFVDYRPATTEETAEFVKRLQKIGMFWNPWAKKMETCNPVGDEKNIKVKKL